MYMSYNSLPKVDIVGSFLLPDELMEARSRYDYGATDRQRFESIENEAVARLVEDQLAAGLTEVTSGEFRRRQWDKDFWFGLNGISCERVESGHIYQPLDPFTDMMRFIGRISYNPDHPFLPTLQIFIKSPAAEPVAGRHFPHRQISISRFSL